MAWTIPQIIMTWKIFFKHQAAIFENEYGVDLVKPAALNFSDSRLNHGGINGHIIQSINHNSIINFLWWLILVFASGI